MSYSLPWNNLGVFSYGGLAGMAGVNLAAWAAGTQITYTNTNLDSNTFWNYSDQDIANAFANSGLFVPTSVIVHTTYDNQFFELRARINITIQGVLPVTVAQS